jgi:multiple sugar transport system permease protein
MPEARSFRIFRYVVVTVLGIFTVVPFYVMVTTAVKPLGDVQGEFHWWPTHMTLRPFIDIWSTVPLARYFLNSLLVCVLSTVFSVIIAIFAAYAVSRYRFRGRSAFTGIVLSTQMFPGILFLLPFSIWMLASYLDGIPRELDEAAKVDGTGDLGALFRIVLPAARPGVVAVAVYAFMTAWGEVLFASVMTNDSTKTLSIGLQYYSTQINVYWNQVMAASLVVSVPVVVGFLLLQRYLVAGLTSGAVK